jgi:hypothetical protein
MQQSTLKLQTPAPAASQAASQPCAAISIMGSQLPSERPTLAKPKTQQAHHGASKQLDATDRAPGKSEKTAGQIWIQHTAPHMCATICMASLSIMHVMLGQVQEGSMTAAVSACAGSCKPSLKPVPRCEAYAGVDCGAEPTPTYVWCVLSYLSQLPT